MSARAFALVVSFVLCAGGAHAERRFALLVGHNRGTENEVRLHYADNDARRMSEALRSVGGVRADDVVMLTEDSDSADDVMAALRGLLARAESATAAGEDTVLIVYYSGHADSSALHLSEHRLELRALDDVLQQSSVKARLLIVDACRSGSLTRVKGEDDALTASGYAVVTAASAAEDANEADEVQGSYFTHALVSGVRGAADVDGDGIVTLSEAFQHAYDATVLRTARADGGVQHPTFRHELRGHQDLVLARLDDELAYVVAPDDTDVVLALAGRVIAEVNAGDHRRTVAVPAGVYDVVIRGDRVVHEGTVDVRPRQSTVIDIDDLDSAGYAHLVRKGGGDVDTQWGAALGVLGGYDHVATLGAELSVPVVWRFFTVTPRAAYAHGEQKADFSVPGREGTDVLPTFDALDVGRVSVTAGPVLDLGFVGFGAGGVAGVEGVLQHTTVNGDELTPVFAVGAFAGVEATTTVTFFDRVYVEGGVEVHFGTLSDSSFGNGAYLARAAVGFWP